MCIEDYRLGRASYSNLKGVDLTNTSSEVLPASMRRTAVVFSSANASGYYLSNSPCINDQCAFYIPANSPPFKLTLVEDGDIVRKGWFAESASVNISIGVIETQLDKE